MASTVFGAARLFHGMRQFGQKRPSRWMALSPAIAWIECSFSMLDLLPAQSRKIVQVISTCRLICRLPTLTPDPIQSFPG